MVGTPVKVYDDTPPDCKVTKGTTLTFHKAVDTITRDRQRSVCQGPDRNDRLRHGRDPAEWRRCAPGT